MFVNIETLKFPHIARLRSPSRSVTKGGGICRSFFKHNLAAEKPDRQIGVLHSAYVCQWSKSPHLFEIALQGFIN